MNIKKVPENTERDSAACECLAACVEARFECGLSFAEIGELTEKCGFWETGKDWNKTFDRPLTFVVPATQLFASVSRRVE
jgi:hypothetical protein